MRKMLCTIWLVLLVNGCATYHYQPGKTLEQSLKDSKECMAISPAGDLTFYPYCMRDCGYKKLSKKQLPAGVRTQHVGVISLYYVAGK